MLHRRGVRATIDEVAAVAGVSRRTVFRYFPTQGQLFATAATEVLAEYDAVVLVAPAPGSDIDAWLLDAARGMHRLHADAVGTVFWDLYARRAETPPERAEVLASQPQVRPRWGTRTATLAWRASGRRDAPPSWLVDAFILQLSGFAYEGLAIGNDRDPGVTARTSARFRVRCSVGPVPRYGCDLTPGGSDAPPEAIRSLPSVSDADPRAVPCVTDER